MKNRDLISSLFFIGVGIIFCVGAANYGFKHLGSIGPGFLPFIAGMILISLSIGVLIPAFKRRKDKTIGTQKFFPEKDSLKKLLNLLLALFGYSISLKYLGFPLTTFLFMVFLLRFIEPERWVTIFIVASVITVSFYLLFDLLLKVLLPKGILGI